VVKHLASLRDEQRENMLTSHVLSKEN
jgi:hypothetical protein